MTSNVGKVNVGGEKYVTKALKIRLDVTPREERIINQNIGNAGFTWNRLLERVKYQKVKPNLTNLNKIINELKREYPFLKKSESSSLQQVGRDIINAHEKHEKEGRGFPRFKSRKNPKNSYRIQCNSNNIRLNEKGTRIRIPKIGFVKFSTSKEYVQELKESKINHMTVKRENGIYHALVNVDTVYVPSKNPGGAIGIDLGIRRPATCSNGLKIHPLDLTNEEDKITKYQEEMSNRKPGSTHYKTSQKKYWKWLNKKINKKNDAYHKFTSYLTKENYVIAMEDLNIRGWFKNRRWAPKLQKTSVYQLVKQLRYKSKRENRKFIQIDRWYPSSKICNNCGYIYEDLKMGEEEWTCPKCGCHHDRDLNASINIKNKGLKDLLEK